MSNAETKEAIAARVLEQYEGEGCVVLERYMMGGGGHNIHFGVFKDPSWGVREASDATTAMMLDFLSWGGNVDDGAHVLDLGSGHGGATHAMVQRFGCRVTGINLGEEQNKVNMARCQELGIHDKVHVLVGDINERLPFDDNSFDACFCCEVLCHVPDRLFTIQEVKRVLKPGGVFVLSDIMSAEGVDEQALSSFTDRNATPRAGTPSMYLQDMKDAGMQYVAWWDNSEHLEKYFREMLKQINVHRKDMEEEGVPEQLMDNWVQSLTARAEAQATKGILAHGFFLCCKA